MPIAACQAVNDGDLFSLLFWKKCHWLPLLFCFLFLNFLVGRRLFSFWLVRDRNTRTDIAEWWFTAWYLVDFSLPSNPKERQTPPVDFLVGCRLRRERLGAGGGGKDVFSSGKKQISRREFRRHSNHWKCVGLLIIFETSKVLSWPDVHITKCRIDDQQPGSLVSFYFRRTCRVLILVVARLVRKSKKIRKKNGGSPRCAHIAAGLRQKRKKEKRGKAALEHA